MLKKRKKRRAPTPPKMRRRATQRRCPLLQGLCSSQTCNCRPAPPNPRLHQSQQRFLPAVSFPVKVQWRRALAHPQQKQLRSVPHHHQSSSHKEDPCRSPMQAAKSYKRHQSQPQLLKYCSNQFLQLPKSPSCLPLDPLVLPLVAPLHQAALPPWSCQHQLHVRCSSSPLPPRPCWSPPQD